MPVIARIAGVIDAGADGAGRFVVEIGAETAKHLFGERGKEAIVRFGDPLPDSDVLGVVIGSAGEGGRLPN